MEKKRMINDNELEAVVGGLQMIKQIKNSGNKTKIACQNCRTVFEVDLAATGGYSCPNCGKVFMAQG